MHIDIGWTLRHYWPSSNETRLSVLITYNIIYTHVHCLHTFSPSSCRQIHAPCKQVCSTCMLYDTHMWKSKVYSSCNTGISSTQWQHWDAWHHWDTVEASSENCPGHGHTDTEKAKSIQLPLCGHSNPVKYWGAWAWIGWYKPVLANPLGEKLVHRRWGCTMSRVMVCAPEVPPGPHPLVDIDSNCHSLPQLLPGTHWCYSWHTHTHTHTHPHTHTHTHIHTCTHTHTHLHACTHRDRLACTHAHTHTHLHARAPTLICSLVSIVIMDTHTCMHRNMQTQSFHSLNVIPLTHKCIHYSRRNSWTWMQTSAIKYYSNYEVKTWDCLSIFIQVAPI